MYFGRSKSNAGFDLFNLCYKPRPFRFAHGMCAFLEFSNGLRRLF
jgi:hypothetical protein